MTRLDKEEIKTKKQKINIKCDICGKIFDREYYNREKLFSKYGKDLCKGCGIRSSNKVGKKVSNELTLSCEYCQEEYKVPYARRDSRFCSKKCQVRCKKTQLKEKKKTSICFTCGNEFKHYGESITCSKKCYSNYMSKIRLGENNPNFKKDKEMSKCIICNTEFEYSRIGLHKGQKRNFCSRKCSGKNKNKSSEDLYIYNKKYNRDFRKKRIEVLKRDNNCCQLCESKNKLEIHHIDDNSLNDEDQNLITLCKKCHNMTKHNRGFWQRVFIGLSSNSKVVKKGWGLEIHFVNNEKYCLKYLVFFKGKKFSLHFHNIKQELWFCMWGSFKCKIVDGLREDNLKFIAGNKIEIVPGVIHQLEALTNSIITEVSTTDYPEDSIRIEKGD